VALPRRHVAFGAGRQREPKGGDGKKPEASRAGGAPYRPHQRQIRSPLDERYLTLARRGKIAAPPGRSKSDGVTFKSDGVTPL